jgi:hypothetical protein
MVRISTMAPLEEASLLLKISSKKKPEQAHGLFAVELTFTKGSKK